ncbi:MAG: hypothetical protein A2583_07715 [Bdellovibrionales bacterium RIFOXYD1_FULL_53_11]|nr:MAG: hypothetical protein A2583_07715 [Bdellovibrionales bacterium RIFOXYD1_FULL_53_11]
MACLIEATAIANDNPFESAREERVYAAFKHHENAGMKPPVTGLGKHEILSLYLATVNNRVAGLDMLPKYDPDSIIGFCFGRAMTAQLGARQSGLVAASIAKLFVTGALCSKEKCKKPDDRAEWYFHVTTIVRGADNTWFAIDPAFYVSGKNQPLTAAEWISTVRRIWDTWHGGPRRARIYLTSGAAVIPDLRQLPRPETGKHIIELNFIPERHGIKASENARRLLGVTDPEEIIYPLEQSQEDRFFLSTRENAAGRFNFLGLLINGRDAISYNGYFEDLMDTEFMPKPVDYELKAVRVARGAPQPPRTEVTGSFRRYGPDGASP